MTPKILKAGLLVGALVFALVSCGQNTKPTVNLKASYTFAPDERTKRFKISEVIKDKDNDSLTLSSFTSSNQAAWITLEPESKPTHIILNAATLPPAPGDQPGRATVKFQVSDGTETITVSMDVIVQRPPFGCMILGDTAIVPSACELGSVHMPDTLTASRTVASIDVIKIPLHRYDKFMGYATVAEEDDAPNYADPVVVGGARYLSGTAPRLVDCDVTVDYDKDGTVNNDEDCLEITLLGTPAERKDTPEGVTVMIEITAENDTNMADDDVTDIIHFKVEYS